MDRNTTRSSGAGAEIGFSNTVLTTEKVATVSSDAERKGDYRRCYKARIPAKHAQRVFEILEHRFHCESV